MAQLGILINVDKATFKEVHDLMGMKLEHNGITIHKMCEGGSKQQFYRELLRAGIKAKLLEFENKKKEIENED